MSTTRTVGHPVPAAVTRMPARSVQALQAELGALDRQLELLPDEGTDPAKI